MKAMLLERLGSIADDPSPLRLADVPTPRPGDDEVLIRVSACGVCHTELDEIEGRTPPPRLPVIPGHQVIGRIEQCGRAVTRHVAGDRVGVGWIFHSSGKEDENISDEFRATGRDADGGYAEFMVVHERYAYPIPGTYSDVEAAPLLCAGGVGYRSLMLCELADGEPLGLTGFGGSGHLVLQLAKFLYASSPVYVFARSPAERAFARELGADWAGDTGDRPPLAPAAIIDTTPAWKPVLAALTALRPAGRLVINAIRKTDTDKGLMATIDYASQLWQEKSVRSVANVAAADIDTMLRVAAEAGIRPEVTTFPLREANRALNELAAGDVRGAMVLQIGD